MLLLSFYIGVKYEKRGRFMGGKIIIDVSKESEPVLQNLYHALKSVFGTAVSVENSNMRSFPGLDLYLLERRATVDNTPISLTVREFDTLAYLTAHPGWVFSKEQIYEKIWKEIPEDVDNTVMCLISSLRRKLEKDTDVQYIHTVWGLGYKFEITPEK